jgi:hypothetical protein
MPGDEGEPPEDRVRRALVKLGADDTSAPDVPAAVTDRLRAALRSAPVPPAHAASPRRIRWVALVVGIGAVVAAAAIAVAILSHPAPAPRFPSGPTADTMTVPPQRVDTPKPVVTGP